MTTEQETLLHSLLFSNTTTIADLVWKTGALYLESFAYGQMVEKMSQTLEKYLRLACMVEDAEKNKNGEVIIAVTNMMNSDIDHWKSTMSAYFSCDEINTILSTLKKKLESE